MMPNAYVTNVYLTTFSSKKISIDLEKDYISIDRKSLNRSLRQELAIYLDFRWVDINEPLKRRFEKLKLDRS